MGQAVLASYLIGLREGLEATLGVSILVAYLVKSGRRDRLVPLWAGVVAAVAASVLFGALLTYTETSLLADFRSRELFEAITSVLAVVLVTWMIFWMRRTARRLKGELTGKLESALGVGTLAVAGIAFVSVIREGLETALFLWAATQTATGAHTVSTVPAWQPLTGAALGLATAVALGHLLYRGAIRINLSTFFTWTGAFLIVVAAGVLGYGVHDLQEAGVLPGLNALAFDVSRTVDEGSWYGAVLKGVLNFSPQTTWLQALAWLAYLAATMTAFLSGVRRRSRTLSPAAVPAPDKQPV